jgi:hypothetical protein
MDVTKGKVSCTTDVMLLDTQPYDSYAYRMTALLSVSDLLVRCFYVKVTEEERE